MKTLKSLALASMILLSACANLNNSQHQTQTQTQTQTRAQQQSSQIYNKINASNVEARACNDKARETPAGLIVSQSILVYSDTQPNKFDLLSSKAKLTQPQQKALKELLSITSKCRQIRIVGHAGTPLQSILIKSDADRDLVYTKLLTGKLSVGDANAELRRIHLQTRDALTAAGSDLNRKLQDQSRAEVSNQKRQQMCNQLSERIKQNDPSQNSWMALQNSLDGMNARAGNFGSGGVAMTNSKQQQQQDLLSRLQQEYVRNCQ
jgi:hypothetical protein